MEPERPCAICGDPIVGENLEVCPECCKDMAEEIPVAADAPRPLARIVVLFDTDRYQASVAGRPDLVESAFSRQEAIGLLVLAHPEACGIHPDCREVVRPREPEAKPEPPVDPRLVPPWEGERYFPEPKPEWAGRVRLAGLSTHRHGFRPKAERPPRPAANPKKQERRLGYLEPHRRRIEQLHREGVAPGVIADRFRVNRADFEAFVGRFLGGRAPEPSTSNARRAGGEGR